MEASAAILSEQARRDTAIVVFSKLKVARLSGSEG
jgi:hypothetical protein